MEILIDAGVAKTERTQSTIEPKVPYSSSPVDMVMPTILS